MFTLLSGLWKYLFQKDEYCILILGLDNAGKSTLLEQIKRIYGNNYSGLAFEKIKTTIGLNIGKITMNHVKLIFWDLGGQQELRSLWDKYYEECHGVIYVIDSSDERRLEESQKDELVVNLELEKKKLEYKCHKCFELEFKVIFTFETVMHDSHMEGTPLLILANKQDLQGSLDVETVKNAFDGNSSSIGQRDYYIQPTSALTGDGISDGISWLVQRVKGNLDRPPRKKDIT
ncbi:ADP-ribosylation factor-related protein 1 [Acropora cervicornis]|uniref:ADP-ribosylation factor-related protein 1 n=1 Tax=Acropora cervicornis TaxID=6130 RepID=A0AAD9R6K6_ACRCE|nr:ADP-ribosylation factor-related protein 1 [Acropora cervicornis]